MPSSRIERNGRGQDYLGVDQIERIRREKFRSLRTPEKRSLRLLNLREKFEEHFPSEITIRDDLFPGVVFEGYGRIHEIEEKRRR